VLETLTRHDFERRLGQGFRLALSAAEALDLTLIEVREAMAGGLGSPHRAPFSVVFRGGPRTRHLPQQIYDLTHPELGTLSIFIVPIGPDSEGMRYEAVFT
jgi:hypothetical protein